MTKQLELVQPTLAAHATPATEPQKHADHCFAGQPAGCPGYFEEDVLPCVCGLGGTALQALNAVAVPVVAIGNDEIPAPREMASVA
jgi:hypothetical protein